jgi:hypothetical protein
MFYYKIEDNVVVGKTGKKPRFDHVESQEDCPIGSSCILDEGSGVYIFNLPTKSEEDQTSLTHAECKRRIYSEWDADQQWNALAGADGYTEQDKIDCLNWVNACRSSRDAILSHEDILTIDVTDDQYWPIYGD